MAVMVEAWGDYALFSRPELRTERYSYDVITPSAARGLLDAILWHPGLRWQIDRIYVLNPICFSGVRRNEVKTKVLASNVESAMKGRSVDLYCSTPNEIVQRASVVLRKVRYVIEAHFEMTDAATQGDNPGKFADMMRRRLSKGQEYAMPYLGCREFRADFRAWSFGADEAQKRARQANPGERDMGLMLFDMDYTNPADITPTFFRAKLVDGVLEVAGREVFK